MTVLITSHRKDWSFVPGHGYGRNLGTALRPRWVIGRGGRSVTKLIIHATHGGVGTQSVNEAKFLHDSPDVSAHALIGKVGEVYQILPDDAVAWHAGVVKEGWAGRDSIGWEMHHAIGESYTTPQMETLTTLTLAAILKYALGEADIDTHRAVALPCGRKSDPGDWSDEDFYAWRASLFAPPAEPDWAGMWGADYPYRPDWGIATAWRAAHTSGNGWGRALSDEEPFNGATIQLFERAVVTWRNGQINVYRGGF